MFESNTKNQITEFTKEVREQIEKWSKKCKKEIIPWPVAMEFIAKMGKNLLKACDIIEQQARENKRLEEANRWIPVSERLPENKGQIFLFYWPEGWKQNRHQEKLYDVPAEIACFICEGKGKYTFQWGSLRFGYSSWNFATHWKPIVLPEQALKESK